MNIQSVIDYGQYNRRPVTTTRTTKTTTKEYDSKGKVVKETIVEETTSTTEEYPQWQVTNTPTVTNLDVKYGAAQGRTNTLEFPLE